MLRGEKSTGTLADSFLSLDEFHMFFFLYEHRQQDLDVCGSIRRSIVNKDGAVY
jgi:hypothetical protein